MSRFYTGVGSRQTPKDVLDIMTRLARWLDNQGWMLRTGDAKGADSAFAAGAGFNAPKIYKAHDATPESINFALSFHGKPDILDDFARKLHGRNVFQIVGDQTVFDKDAVRIDQLSSMVICWTPDGCISHRSRNRWTGGTGTAISIADYYGIPVFNLQRPEHRERVLKKIGNF